MMKILGSDAGLDQRFPNVQCDFEKLVRESLLYGRGKLTFGGPIKEAVRLNLFYAEDGFRLVVTALSSTVDEQQIYMGAEIATSLVQRCVEHLSFDEGKTYPFRGGSFVPIGRVEVFADSSFGSPPGSMFGTHWHGPVVWPVPQRDEREAAQRSPRKLGRNEPCPCGSGKKYKRCCAVRVN
jgi:hypothetical protein